MNVLSVSKSTGGVAVYNRTLCRELGARGHEVSSVCLSEGRESYAASLRAIGVSTVELEMERYSIAPLSDLRLARRLAGEVRRRRPAVLVAHGAKAGLVTRLAGRLAGVPVVYVLHSQPYLERVQGRRAFFYRQLERVGTLLGGHLVALTGSMADELRRLRIAPASRVTVIYTGIDPRPFGGERDRSEARRALGLAPDRPVVGWAGRFNAQKAPLDFVRVAARLARDTPEVQLLMAGEGPLAQAVRELARELGLEERLLTVAWQEDVPGMLAALDVYVATSHWEGLPLSLLEAMAAGRAVVATAVDGVAEAVEEGVSGYLTAAGDVESLADRAGRLVRDAELRARVGAAARTRVEARFTAERMMADWEALLERLGSAGAAGG